MLDALPPDPAVGVIILDACRDNPLARSLAKALPMSRSSSMGSGLAPVQANGLSHDAGGLLIAYATDPGSVAYDGKDAHSPYTTALARHLATPGLEIQSALTRVRAEVSEATNGAQRPWHNASLAREVFIGGDAPAPEPGQASRRPPVAARRPPPPAGGGSRLDGRAEIVGRGVQAQHGRALRALSVAISRGPLRQCRAPEPRPAQGGRGNRRGDARCGGRRRSRHADGLGFAKPHGGRRIGRAPPDAGHAGDRGPAQPGQGGTDRPATAAERARSHIGTFDGSLGPRSRAAIAAWQRQSGIVETTYLTPQQHMFLVVQTDPMMAQVRAQYEAQKAAWTAKPKAAKPAAKTAEQGDDGEEAAGRHHDDTAPAHADREGQYPHRPRHTNERQPVDNSAGSFAAGALLGTGIGLVIGRTTMLAG